MTASLALTVAEVDAKVAWSRRVRRVGGFIQVAFAALWLIRGSLNIDGGVGVALAVMFVFPTPPLPLVTAYTFSGALAIRPDAASWRRLSA